MEDSIQAAENLKYTSAIKWVLADLMKRPHDGFVRFVLDAADGEVVMSDMMLHKLARSGNVEGVRRLRYSGRINEKDVIQRTPLHCAANEDVARVLVEAGARPNARDKHEQTPLHRAVVNRYLDVAAYLIDEAGASLNVRDDRGRMPLHWSAIKDDASTAIVLLRAGAMPYPKDHDGSTPLRLAMTRGSMSFVWAYLEAGMTGVR